MRRGGGGGERSKSRTSLKIVFSLLFFRNDLYVHQGDSIRFALFLMTLDSRVRAQGVARGQDLGHLIFFFFF